MILSPASHVIFLRKFSIESINNKMGNKIMFPIFYFKFTFKDFHYVLDENILTF